MREGKDVAANLKIMVDSAVGELSFQVKSPKAKTCIMAVFECDAYVFDEDPVDGEDELTGIQIEAVGGAMGSGVLWTSVLDAIVRCGGGATLTTWHLLRSYVFEVTGKVN